MSFFTASYRCYIILGQYVWRRKDMYVYITLDKVQIQNDKKYDSNNT